LPYNSSTTHPRLLEFSGVTVQTNSIGDSAQNHPFSPPGEFTMQPRHILIKLGPPEIPAIGMLREDAQPRAEKATPLQLSIKSSSRRVVAPLGALAISIMLASVGTVVNAQDAESAPAAVPSTAPVIPQQVRFSGSLPNRMGDTVEAVFRIYASAEGGKPLWTETQNIAVASDGSYNVLLGAASSKGLPQTVFGSGQARWVGVAVERGDEEARIPLASAAYAMKAADAQTLGGLPASNFVTRAQLAATAQALAVDAVQQITPLASPTGSGTTNYVPLWTSASVLGSSEIYQSTTSSVRSYGIGTTSPAARVHIVGTGGTVPSLVIQGGGGLGVIKMGGDVNANTLTASVRKLARITMPDWAADSLGVTLFSGDVTGANANDLYFGGTPGGSQYAATGLHFVTATNGTTTGGTEQATLTSAGSFGIGTTTPAAKLEVNGTAKFDGNITFASTQTFPVKGTGGGTITGITTTSPLTGSGTTGSVALALNETTLRTSLNDFYPQLNAVNQFVGDQSVVDGTLTGAGLYAAYGSSPGNPAAVFTGGPIAYGFDSYEGTAGDGVDATGGGGSNSGTDFGGVGGSFIGGIGFSAGGDGVYGKGGSPLGTSGETGLAGYFDGNAEVSGTLYAGATGPLIDHPQDPANKYLEHAAVGSSEMMNIYTGNVTTDQNGNAVVMLPDWFESLNADFRYQLTVVGKFAQAIVSKEIEKHQFTISTNATFTKVSWLVTAVRHDAYATAHPLQVEKDKPARERGYYLHPELFGQPAEKSVAARRHPAAKLHPTLQTRSALRATTNTAGKPATAEPR
jgi:hypothetical protein